MIDLAWLQKLIEMVDESGLDSIEISRGIGTRIRLSKSPTVQIIAGSGSGQLAPSSAAAAIAAPAVGVPSGEADAGSEAAEDTSTGPALLEVTSPMVGTFYRAPAPDAPPYAEVGDRVSKGQTVCILEAMKLMNELECEVSGTIREICVENADPVEYGQVLFRIEPA
jgi:acetyl-CoA carboxylase biotin carboxyl carrier protein